MEFAISGRRHVDCLTATHAIEVDFSRNWNEAIGQALDYALETNKKPGIVLIMDKPSSYKHLMHLNSVIRHFNLPIDVWQVGPDDPRM